MCLEPQGSVPFTEDELFLHARTRGHAFPDMQEPGPPADLIMHTVIKRFKYTRTGLRSMHDIVATRKMENGVACYFGESGSEELESFTYQELIDQKINALDLLKDPKNYAVDTDTHRVVMKK